MRQIDLREYQESGPETLSVIERDALQEPSLSLSVRPVRGTDRDYHLTPGSTVGAVEIGDLSVLIQPKIGIPQLLSLACYAMGIFKPDEHRLFDFKQEEALPDALALALTSAARRAFAHGLLHGYRIEEEALYGVRGRIRFEDQLRRRFGIAVPVEVRYDDFTNDILANQLVKAALVLLGAMRLRSRDARRGLGWIAATLDNVSPVEFPPSEVPEVAFDRLNEHYRDVVGLSRLVLRHSAFQSARGAVRAAGFLMDMNEVFQEFVTQALRESLGVSDRVLRSDNCLPHEVTLDKAGQVSLRPDLSWWEDSRVCTFVGDAKYKRIVDDRVPNADLYQLLAYVTALDLPGGLLIYAASDSPAATHHVRHCGKRLEVAALDLSGSFDDILARIGGLADRVRRLRREARAARPASPSPAGSQGYALSNIGG